MKLPSGRYYDMRSVLEDAGVSDGLIHLALEHVYELPQTSDPSSYGVQLIVGAIQRELRRKGYAVRETGSVGQRTRVGIRELAGDDWLQRPWGEVLLEVLESDAPPVTGAVSYRGAAALDGVVTDFFWSPVGLAAVAAVAWVIARRR